MNRRVQALLGVCLALLLGFGVLAGPIDSFLQQYQSGNIHTLIYEHPVDIIRELGTEPDSYDYYASDERIFTYVDVAAHEGIGGVSFIWTGDRIMQIRITFVGSVSTEDAIRSLGYSLGFFDAPVIATNRLGNTPYYTSTYSKPDSILSIGGTYMKDLDFMFLLEHFSESAYMLIISTS